MRKSLLLYIHGILLNQHWRALYNHGIKVFRREITVRKKSQRHRPVWYLFLIFLSSAKIMSILESILGSEASYDDENYITSHGSERKVQVIFTLIALLT